MRRFVHVVPAVLLVVVGVAACGSSTDDAIPGTTVHSPDTTMPNEDLALVDGRHPAFITGVDVSGRRLTINVIQFLTGEDAARAYQEDHPDTEEGPPNDYYIVDASPRTRTVPLARDASITMNTLAGTGAEDTAATLDELAEALQGEGADEIPFWLTLVNGTVTAIEEQYTP